MLEVKKENCFDVIKHVPISSIAGTHQLTRSLLYLKSHLYERFVIALYWCLSIIVVQKRSRYMAKSKEKRTL